MEDDRKLITLIIPVYNEEEVLELLYERLKVFRDSRKDYRFEFLFINDGSTDKTLEIIKNLREKDKDISYINLARNFGKETSMLAGLDYAKGDAVVFLDADLQDPPELINEFIKYWEQGYDDVYAQRKTREGESWLKKLTSKIYYRLLSKLTRIPIQIDTGDFRLLDRRVVNALKKAREDSRSMKSMMSWVGYKKKAVFFDRPERAAGETKWNFVKLVGLAIDGITALSIRPLKIAIPLSIPLMLGFLVYLIFIIVKLIVNKGILNPFHLIILLILFFGTIQVVLIGIISEYLGRIFIESKNRPLYLIDEYNDEKERNE